jgi:LAS superfamily LD-carboxypeptidase LdcB
MRIIEPQQHHFHKTPKAKFRKPKNKRLQAIILLVAIFIILCVVFWPSNKAAAPTDNAVKTGSNTIQISPAPPPPRPKVLKTFTGDEFRDLYNNFAYPNTEQITSTLSITGNATADARIRKLSESRGYKLRSIPVAPIQKIGDPNLSGDDLLQSKALEAWRELQKNAKQSNIDIRILSAYRSPELQRSIFNSRLNATGVSIAQIANGEADGAVNAVLKTTSVPGYSRHHTGYTVDFQCGNGTLEAFENSPCYTWISKNNYENAKKAGWIPSYPAGTSLQGPDPEPWEYVWVGTDSLYQ